VALSGIGKKSRWSGETNKFHCTGVVLGGEVRTVTS